MEFLTSEKSYEGQIIYEHEHNLQIEDKPNNNSIPKYVVKMEDLYDFKDSIKKVTNSKTQSSTLKFELINLGTPENLKTSTKVLF